MSEFLLQILEYLPKVDANVLFTSDDCTSKTLKILIFQTWILWFMLTMIQPNW